jgi:hypothetical protein
MEVNFDTFSRADRKCEIIDVLPKKFSIYGGVMLTVFIEDCSETSNVDITVAGFPCQILTIQKNKMRVKFVKYVTF